ncbi:hypothetical protein AB1Y20_012814 [Prymnesium parvum]|uniref:Replitron HUH endonuclease domain-containing protein n=1 Tax=Prymnesium parvum TaxID=97485 RepID=A0AB34IMG6_PRYPA
MLKKLDARQTFEGMLGYCTKDQGKSHYQLVVHNVPDDEIQRGRSQSNAMRQNFEQNYVSIKRGNLFQLVLNHVSERAELLHTSFLQALTHMLNTNDYIPSATYFNHTSGKLDHASAEGMWRLLNKQHLSESMVAAMFFNNSDNAAKHFAQSRSQSTGATFGQRFYQEVTPTTSPQPARCSNAASPQESYTIDPNPNPTFTPFERVRNVLARRCSTTPPTAQASVPLANFVAVSSTNKSSLSGPPRKRRRRRSLVLSEADESDAPLEANSTDPHAAHSSPEDADVSDFIDDRNDSDLTVYD